MISHTQTSSYRTSKKQVGRITQMNWKKVIKMEVVGYCTVEQKYISGKQGACMNRAANKQHANWMPAPWWHGTRDMPDQTPPTTYSNVCWCRLNYTITASTAVTWQQRLDTTARIIIHWAFVKANKLISSTAYWQDLHDTTTSYTKTLPNSVYKTYLFSHNNDKPIHI